MDFRILKGYKPHENEVWLNVDDPDLIPIKVNILDLIQRTFREYKQKEPTTFPIITLIDGFGQKIEDQFFKRYETPAKLNYLIDKIKKRERKRKLNTDSWITVHTRIINEFWDILDKKHEEYHKEIIWLKKLWYYRLFGYWFMNNGLPTYMTGSYFMYLNYYYLPTGILPQYRDRDRRWFISQKFLRLDTKTFAKLDKDGFAIPNTKGKRDYEMIDIERKVFYGSVHPKARRVGDTSKSSEDVIEESTRTLGRQFANQGVDDDTSERIFKSYITKPYEKYPIFLKPLQKRLDPQEEMRFESGDEELKLGSWIDYATSRHATKYDGATLKKYYGDEIGKLQHGSIVDRHSTIKLALSERDIIDGNITYTTTVEKMELKGGREFLKLCKDSNFYQRKPNGQTISGLAVIYFSAADGHPLFIDKYGMSIIDNPTPEQAKFICKKIGAREYILNDRRLHTGEALAKKKRQEPLSFREVFTPPPKSTFFNTPKVQRRVSEIQMMNGLPYRIGDFVWEQNKFGRVVFVDGSEGRFRLSTILTDSETNRWILRDGMKFPEGENKYILSADPFRLDKTDSWRMSNGGIAVLWERDKKIDPNNKDISKWKSNRFVCTYCFRPDTTDEFAEDVLKCAIYFSCLVYPEMNIDLIQKKFIDWGYRGFLLYDTDLETKAKKNNCGFTTIHNKSEIFNLVRDHIELHCDRERHDDLLKDILEIQSPQEMTNYDLFTAAGGCLLAVRSDYKKHLLDQQAKYNTSQWIPTYEY